MERPRSPTRICGYNSKRRGSFAEEECMNSVVDADTHILESSAIWDLIDPEMYSRRPVLISIPNDTVYGGRNAFWLIDGNIVPKPAGKGGFILHTPSVAEIES